MTTNEKLAILEQNLEADVLEARSELEQGRKAALQRSMAREASDHIHNFADQAERDLRLVQGRLGELNYILAEDKVNDLDTFNRYSDRILDGIRAARDDIAKLIEQGDEWSLNGSNEKKVWRPLLRQLISVQHHLENENEKAATSFSTERTQLAEDLASAVSANGNRGTQKSFISHVRKELRQLIPAVKTMFMYVEEPAREVNDSQS